MATAVTTALEGWLNPLQVGAAIGLAFLFPQLWAFFHDPLTHIPGPLVARLTPLWLWRLTWSGIESRSIAALHDKYGPVVRIAPNEVDISDGAAIHSVYVENGGFPKSPLYANYHVDGFPTIFSDLDLTHRATRAKAVAPMFAQQALVRGKAVMQSVVDKTVKELERRKAEADGAPVDTLNLFRALALDSMTAYLFGESFNGVDEKRLSATAFIDDFVASGRFFYLPGWIFKHVLHWAAQFDKNSLAVATSSDIVKEFATRVVDRSIVEEDCKATTYQGRLLKAGVSREETIAQVVDVMFAGTDSFGRTLSVLCWYLVRHPDKHERARKEISETPSLNTQPPYLSGVVKESLRLSMATPTRLPRIVPSGSQLHLPGLPTIPAGTSVGLSAYALHNNPAVFVNPREFIPERWAEPTPEMLRDSFYFGMGSRQCIARNLAFAELMMAAEAIIHSDVLNGAAPVKEKLEIREWFNAKTVGEAIEFLWPSLES